MKLSGYHLHTLRFHFRCRSTFRGTFFQDGRQFTMLYVQTCLVRGPNKVEEHRRCHFQLHQGCRLICRNQISLQIQHGCQPCPHVQCGCGCLSNVQTCLVWVPNSIAKHLKYDSQLYLGCPFGWWKQIWHQIQNGRQTCPPCQVFSHAFLGGPNIVDKELRYNFQLTMVWSFCLWKQIWHQIQYGCGPLCVMFKHGQFGYLSHIVEKQLIWAICTLHMVDRWPSWL